MTMPAYRMRNAVALAGLIVAAVLCATPSAFAQRAAVAESRPSAKTSKATSTPNPSGPQATVDAKSTQLREPTRAEAEALIDGMKPYLNTSVEGLTPVYHEDGTVSVDLEGRFQNVTIARIEADGTISQTCVQSPPEARRFLTQRVKAGAKKPATPTSPPATIPAKSVLGEK